MLIDELLNTPIENCSSTGTELLRGWLRKAHKFELAADFAAAAESLAGNLHAITGALPYCRLPFEHTWIEVPQAIRPRFSNAPIHVPGIQKRPKRVGFLLFQHPDDAARFGAFQFWSLPETPLPQAGYLGLRFDPGKAPELAQEPTAMVDEDRLPGMPIAPEWERASEADRAVLLQLCTAIPVPFIDHARFTTLHTSGVLDALGRADWSGEAMFLMGTLALLNTLNAVEIQPVDRGKLNAARAKRGKPALVEHKVITIAPRLKQRIVGTTAAKDGHRELCLHLCRGHFKVRKTGVWWWRAHTRGSKGQLADKVYRVV